MTGVEDNCCIKEDPKVRIVRIALVNIIGKVVSAALRLYYLCKCHLDRRAEDVRDNKKVPEEMMEIEDFTKLAGDSRRQQPGGS